MDALTARAVPTLSTVDDLGSACALLAGGAALAVCCDESGRLRGVLDDLAVRQALLAGCSPRTRVGELVLPEPVTVPSGASPAQVRGLLLWHRRTCAPVVQDGRPVEVATLPGGVPGAEPIALILAGGRGERLRPLTERVPKPLLRVGGAALIERIIRRLAAAGIRQIHIAVNYLAEMVQAELGDGERFGVRLHYLVESAPLGTAGALGLLASPPAGPVLVTNADLVTDVDYRALLAHHWHHGVVATVAASRHHTAIPYGVLRTSGARLTGIEEKPRREDLVGAGMYVLSPEVVRAVPPGCRLDMPDLLAGLAPGGDVGVFPLHESWHDVGTPEQFEEVLVKFATGWNG